MSTRVKRGLILAGIPCVAGLGGACGQPRTEPPKPRRQVSVRVLTWTTARPLPCRITMPDGAVQIAPVQAERRSGTAVRTGVIYTADGTATFTAPAGDYTVHATRGMEYGLASRALRLEDSD